MQCNMINLKIFICLFESIEKNVNAIEIVNSNSNMIEEIPQENKIFTEEDRLQNKPRIMRAL